MVGVPLTKLVHRPKLQSTGAPVGRGCFTGPFPAGFFCLLQHACFIPPHHRRTGLRPLPRSLFRASYTAARPGRDRSKRHRYGTADGYCDSPPTNGFPNSHSYAAPFPYGVRGN
jgi:hypothetical protein